MTDASEDASLSSSADEEDQHDMNPQVSAQTSSLHEPMTMGDIDDDESDNDSNQICIDDTDTNTGSNQILKFGLVLSLIVATICLLPLYKDVNFASMVKQYRGNESNNPEQQLTSIDIIADQESNSTITGSMSGTGDSSIASLAYKTAPFDIPYTKIDCQPCRKASKLMNPLAPYAVIGGTMKGGTRALLTYLSQHPDVYSDQGSEMHLLDNSKIKIFAHRDDIVCDQCAVLETYNDNYKQRRKKQKHHDGKDKATDLIFFDKSPSYLVMSHIVPQRMICTFPQTAKVIFTLRNPADRAYSHYQHCVKKYKHKTENNECNGSFEAFVDKDYNGLLAAGVLNASSPIEEFETFLRYHHSKGSMKNFVLAKSLYAITLRSWIAVFRDHFGDDELLDHMLIVESERMRERKQEVFDETLEFLDMSPYELMTEEEYHVGSYEPMSDDMKQRLEAFFRPHNARLHEMLAPLGVEISWAKADAELIN